jgi:hypothetical protein
MYIDITLELHAIAVDLSLDRDTLLMGMNPAFVATIPSRPTRSAQLLTDLYVLNAVRSDDHDSNPLMIWIRNAIVLAAGRLEVIRLDAYLGMLDLAVFFAEPERYEELRARSLPVPKASAVARTNEDQRLVWLRPRRPWANSTE